MWKRFAFGTLLVFGGACNAPNTGVQADEMELRRGGSGDGRGDQNDRGDGWMREPDSGVVLDAGMGEDGPSCEPTTPLTEPLLEESTSAYAELRREIEAFGVADSNGHVDQNTIASWVARGLSEEELAFLFEIGDELSELEFTNADGVGALVSPIGSPINRFSRMPIGERFTGPNARACLDCHDKPFGNGAGEIVNNVLQDPSPTDFGEFNVRNTRNINGDAWLELAAVEMSMELQSQLEICKAEATGMPMELTAKDISFGTILCTRGRRRVIVDYSGLQGVSPDLVVRTQGWKGNMATIRAFSEDAAFGEMGVTSDRFAYFAGALPLPNGPLADLAVPDVDGDGVTHELSVGDITALTLYFVGQSAPTTLEQLDSESLLTAPLTQAQRDLIAQGESAFSQVGCADCHRLSLPVNDPVFRMPEDRASGFADSELLGTGNGYEFGAQILVDLSASPIVEPPRIALEDGAYPVRALTDLKRHTLGEHLCDDGRLVVPADDSFRHLVPPSDSTDPDLEVRLGACEFLTADLWGIAQTGPYLHDGRATTLEEAIMAHCDPQGRGEGNASCVAYGNATASDRAAVIAFLRSQVMRPDSP